MNGEHEVALNSFDGMGISFMNEKMVVYKAEIRDRWRGIECDEART